MPRPVTVIFAAIFLGEQVRVSACPLSPIGLIGVLIVLYPRFTVEGIACRNWR